MYSYSFKKYLSTLLLLLFCLSIQTGYAETGFSFPLKRYEYPQSSKSGISITLSNNTSISYLLESTVISSDGANHLPGENNPDDKIPFIILPPLKQIDPHTKFSWSIRRTGIDVNGIPLPQDRESLFWIRIKAIPAEKKDPKEGISFKVSPEFYFKLLYRPTAIENIRLQDIEDQLIITRTNKQLLIENPSPLFVTFDLLRAGTIDIRNEEALVTVKPFSQQKIDLPSGQENAAITWRISDKNLFGLTIHTVK